MIACLLNLPCPHVQKPDVAVRYTRAWQADCLAMHDVIRQPPWLPFQQAMEHYRRTIQSAGSDFEKMIPDQTLREILEKKHRHGML